ncbi:mitochondrial amidoxime reducing component 2-like [Penaeus japonicus]|uniref:mitochondrial amidoxime reducing component 2-like n=1 Tax=Penaeus japonicus TaxID=27405 RepID=UPI001C7107C5|nr:mitochondrial amidoxime reducing component 2-like [Penaeus japonicus]
MTVRWPAVVGVGVGVGVGALMAWAWGRSAVPSDCWEEVGVVSELAIYPLKSGRPMGVQEAEATRHGLSVGAHRDRSFMVILKEGSLVTGRQKPKLTFVTVKIDGNTATFEAKGVEDQAKVNLEKVLQGEAVDASIFGAEVKGVDCGDDVAKWLSDFLYEGRREVRVLYTHPQMRRRLPKHEGIEFPQICDTDEVLYADDSPFLLLAESSLQDLNTRLDKPVKMNRFRGNISIAGSKPYDEDDWAYVKIGEAVFRMLKPCDRCSFPTVDPETGTKDPDKEPQQTLKAYRIPKSPEKVAKFWSTSPLFGTCLAVDVCGTVCVGEKVLVKRASRNPKWRYWR